MGDFTLENQGLALGIMTGDNWQFLLHFVGKVLGSTWLVGFALVGVGLNLKTEIFRGLGLRI